MIIEPHALLAPGGQYRAVRKKRGLALTANGGTNGWVSVDAMQEFNKFATIQAEL